MIFNIIKDNNIYLVKDFINLIKSKYFRYYDKHSLNILNNHILTLIVTIDDNILGYAHLDKENDKIWFGIYVLEEYQSKGYSKKIIKYIFNYCINNNINKIYLAVDKENLKALYIYKKYNFNIESEGLTNIIMSKDLTPDTFHQY